MIMIPLLIFDKIVYAFATCPCCTSVNRTVKGCCDCCGRFFFYYIIIAGLVSTSVGAFLLKHVRNVSLTPLQALRYS